MSITVVHYSICTVSVSVRDTNLEDTCARDAVPPLTCSSLTCTVMNPSGEVIRSRTASLGRA